MAYFMQRFLSAKQYRSMEGVRSRWNVLEAFSETARRISASLLAPSRLLRRSSMLVRRVPSAIQHDENHSLMR